MLLFSLADGGFERGVWSQVTIAAWWTALVALAAGAWPRSVSPSRAGWATGACLLGLALLAGVSMAWAADQGAAFADAVRAAGYAGLFALALIVVRAGFGRRLLAGIAIGLTLVAVLALLSRLEPGFVQGADEVGALAVSGGRLSYPLGYWNGLGALMAIALVSLVWLGATSRGAGWRALAVGSIPIPVLTLFFTGSRGAAVAAAVGLGALLLAGPRRVTLAALAGLGFVASLPLIAIASGTPDLVDGLETPAARTAGDELALLTAAVVALVAMVVLAFDYRLVRLRLPVLTERRAVPAALVVCVLAVAAFNPAGQVDRLSDPPRAPAEAIDAEDRFANVGGSGRSQFWETALDAFASAPLSGIGAGGFEAFWAVEGSLSVPVQHAHSLFFESAAELGVVGLGLAIGFFAVPAVAGIGRLRRPTAWADHDVSRGTVGAALAVLAAGAVTATLEWSWDLPATFAPVVVAAAVLAAFRTGAPAKAAAGWRRRPASRSPRPVLAVGLVAVAAVSSIAAAGAMFAAERALDESRAETARGDLVEAAAKAHTAADVLPFAADPYVQLALVELRGQRYGAARRAIEQAEDRAPRDWRLWFTDAGIELRAGSTGRAIWALNRARALNPRAPRALFAVPGSAG